MKQSLVQILVVVAFIQVKIISLKAEAGEGFHINSKWI